MEIKDSINGKRQFKKIISCEDSVQQVPLATNHCGRSLVLGLLSSFMQLSCQRAAQTDTRKKTPQKPTDP